MACDSLCLLKLGVIFWRILWGSLSEAFLQELASDNQDGARATEGNQSAKAQLELWEGALLKPDSHARFQLVQN